MSTRTKRFTTVLAVAVLAMAMYGCSSSDDGSGISQDMYDALKAENDTLTTDNGTLTTDNETLTTDNETLTTDNETLTTDNETLKGRVETLEANQKPPALPGPGTDDYEMATALQAAIDDVTAQNFVPAVTAEAGEPVAITLTEAGTPDGGSARSGAFEAQAAGPSSITGWAGARLVRDLSTDTVPDTRIEDAVVYTDIEAPESLAFTTVNVSQLVGASTLTVTDGEITGVNIENSAAYSQHVMLANATPGDTTRTYQATVDPDNSAVFDLALSGTFGAATGEYSCTGSSATACQIVVALDGTFTPTGTWDFTADAGATISLADAAYLHLGWWVEAPGQDQTGNHAFQTFAGATGLTAFTTTNVTALEGSATYEGAAAGVYVLRDILRGIDEGADSGEFTATATLTAEFLDITQAGLINGSISGFMDENSQSMDGWGVTLDTAYLSAASTFSGTTSAAVGSGSDGSGNWNGTFYGDGAAATDAPMAVAGQFDADFPGASIAGAFGAMMSEE